jgi:hypothetical protein
LEANGATILKDLHIGGIRQANNKINVQDLEHLIKATHLKEAARKAAKRKQKN